MGRLPDARYAALDAQYAKEQEALAAEIAELEKTVSSYDQGEKSTEKFIALIDKYQGFEVMTNTMLNEFLIKFLSVSVTIRAALKPPRRWKATSILWTDTYRPLSGMRS